MGEGEGWNKHTRCVADVVWKAHSAAPERAGLMPPLKARGPGEGPWLDSTSEQQLLLGGEGQVLGGQLARGRGCRERREEKLSVSIKL